MICDPCGVLRPQPALARDVRTPSPSPAVAAATGAPDLATPALPVGRLRLVVLLGALCAFGPLSLDMYLAAFPRIAADFSVGQAPVQLTLTACLIGLALGQVVSGPLSDRYGRRRPLLVGVAVYAGASLLCAFAPSVGVLTGLRLLQGLAGAAGVVISRAMVRDLHTGAEAARFFSALMLVNGLAPILAPLLGAQVLELTGWRGVFVVLSAIGLVLLAAVAWGLPETLPAARRRGGGVRETGRVFRGLSTDVAFLGPALSSGLVLGAMFAYISGSSFVLQEVYGLSPRGFSLAFGTNAAGLILLSQVSGRLVGRVSPLRLLTVGVLLSLTGALALLAAVLAGGGLTGVLPALFLVVSSVGLVSPNASALALADHPQVAGSASALLGLSQYALGGLLGPLVGLGGGHSGLPLALVLTGSTLAATAVLCGVVLRR